MLFVADRHYKYLVWFKFSQHITGIGPELAAHVTFPALPTDCIENIGFVVYPCEFWYNFSSGEETFPALCLCWCYPLGF